MEDLKTRVLLLSKHFPKNHIYEGSKTWFKEKLIKANRIYYPVECITGCGWTGSSEECAFLDSSIYKLDPILTCPKCQKVVHELPFAPKLHTLRINYDYWENIYNKNMILSVRQWSDKPYQSKQELIKDFKPGEWGIQKLLMIKSNKGIESFCNSKALDLYTLSENDGLNMKGFQSWFEPYFKNKDILHMVIIHFTPFRY